MTISQANFVEWPCTFRNKLTDRHTVRTHSFHGPTCLLLILIKTSHECARWCCTFPILGSPIPWFSSVNRLRNGIFFPVLLIQKSHISRERERSTRFHCWNIPKLYRFSRDLFLDRPLENVYIFASSYLKFSFGYCCWRWRWQWRNSPHLLL